MKVHVKNPSNCWKWLKSLALQQGIHLYDCNGVDADVKVLKSQELIYQIIGLISSE